MKPTLATALIDKKIITRGTTLQIQHVKKGLSSFQDTSVIEQFRVIGAHRMEDALYFIVLDSEKKQFKFSCDTIITIDGMDANRVALANNLKENGDEITYSRRGRKPKVQFEAV